jgi:hypothetical protein
MGRGEGSSKVEVARGKKPTLYTLRSWIWAAAVNSLYTPLFPSLRGLVIHCLLTRVFWLVSLVVMEDAVGKLTRWCARGQIK